MKKLYNGDVVVLDQDDSQSRKSGVTHIQLRFLEDNDIILYRGVG